MIQFPCPTLSLLAGRNFLGRCLCDPSASLWTVWDSLQPPSSPSVSQGCVHLPDSQFCRPTFCVVRFMCTLFHLTACTLVVGVLFFFQLCRGRVVFAAQVCMPSCITPSRPLHKLCLSAWYLGSPSVLLLARFICPTLATWDCPLCCKGCVRLLADMLRHSRFPSLLSV